MSIIERTTKLLLTQFKGSSIKPAFLEYYTADMKKLDDYAIGADNRLSALEAEDILLDGRLDTLEGWKDNTADPTLTSYNNRLNAIEAVLENISDQNIRDLMERLSALENKVDADTLAISGLTDRVDDLRDTLQELRNAIASANADIVAIGRRIDRLEDCCAEVQETLLNINATLSEHNELIGGLRTDVDRNAQNIQANAEDITILANQIGTLNTNVNSLINDMDVQHIVEFASVNTQNFSSKGLTFNLVSEGGWCKCTISGTTNADITDNDTWDEVVPNGFVPAVNVISTPIVPSNIANQLINFMIDNEGNLSNNAVQTIASGTSINHVINYPLYQPTT